MTRTWVLVTGDFVQIGGQDRANFELAKYLAHRGDEVHLVAHRIDSFLERFPTVRVHLVPKLLNSYALSGPLLSQVGERIARRVRSGNRFARVVVNGGNCRFHDVSWAWATDDAGAPAMSRLKHWLVKGFARREERAVIRRAELVIANSERTRVQLVEGLGVAASRVRVVYLGVDPSLSPRSDTEQQAAKAELGLAPGQRVIAFVGALGHDGNKGFETVLESMSLATSFGSSNSILIVAGDGQLERWKDRARSLRILHRVIFLGRTPNVPQVLRSADLLVAPSRYEAYGLAVQEALCVGVPALVTATAGIAERYPPELESLLIREPRNPRRLAEQVEWALRSTEKLATPVKALGSALRSVSWSDMAKAMADLMDAHPIESSRTSQVSRAGLE